MIKKLLFLFFSWKWRIWRFDFLVWSTIWFTIFIFCFLLIFNFLFNGIVNDDKGNIIINQNQIIIIISIALIFIMSIISWFCLKIKRAQDLWENVSIFSFKSQFAILFKKWLDNENSYWKREYIFNFWEKTKIIITILIIVYNIFIFWLFMSYQFTSIQQSFENNQLVIESKELVIWNTELTSILWPNILYWNIVWSMQTTNNEWELNLEYIIAWEKNEWKVKIIWHKLDWKWLCDKMQITVWTKEYNINKNCIK